MPIQNTKSQREKRQAIVADDQFGRPWMFKIETESLDITADIQPGGRWIKEPAGYYPATSQFAGEPYYSNGIDPLETPQKYFRLGRTRNNRPDLGRVVVDIPRWIADIEVRNRDWVQGLWDVGQRLNPGAKTIKDVESDARCLHWAGQKPWPTVRILKLALAGNRELLGLAPLSPSTQLLLRKLDAQTILREELENLTDQEQAAFRALEAGASKAVAAAVPPEPGDGEELDTWQKFFGHHSTTGLTMAEIAPMWKAHKGTLKAAQAA
jgi:hypothetical protein